MPDMRRARPSPQPARRRRATASGLAAPPAQGTSPQMIGRFPDYDVLESASDWDEATRKVVMARLAPPAELELLLRRSRRRRCAPSAMSCSPRTSSRGCRSSSWSTRSSPPAGSMATSTRTCPTTATPGAWCSRGWITPPRAARHASFADCAAEDQRGIIEGIRRRPARRRALGQRSTSPARGRSARG